MMLRTEADHLPWPIQQELRVVAALLFEAFTDITKDGCSEHRRSGRILALILHGRHVAEDWHEIAPGEAFHLVAIVNHARLARSERDWRIVRDRLQRAWEFGEITHPVRLTVEGLDRVNRALVDGVPHFVAIAEKGVALYQMEGLRLQTPRHLPALDRVGRGFAEYLHWHKRGRDFLAGAAFYRTQGNAPMAALLLHQACEHFYLCALWSIKLHGPRIHALDELREAAEALDIRLRDAWPRDTHFERRAFARIRRAYIEARYGHSYRISQQELAWAFERVAALEDAVMRACADHRTSLIAEPDAPMLPSQAGLAAVALPQLHIEAKALQGASRVVSRARPSGARWNRLSPLRGLWRSNRSAVWRQRIPIGVLGLLLFLAGADTALWLTPANRIEQAERSEPADLSAVLDFDVKADTVLGAVADVAKKAGYQLKANEDIWAIRWTGAYRAKATTFDALADILYGSGLCPVIRGATITVRFCDKTSPPIVATFQYQTVPDEGVQPQISR